MSLDAHVYCECVEKGHLNVPLPADVAVRVDEDGYPVLMRNGVSLSDYLQDLELYPCSHEMRHLLHHWLGNIALISVIRTELSRDTASFPILVNKVVYNGIHGGDQIPVDLFSQLRAELELLSSFRCAGNVPAGFVGNLVAGEFIVRSSQELTSAEEGDQLLKEFQRKMLELLDAAQKVNKPIVF